MRLVQVRVPDDSRDAVYEALGADDIDFVATETLGAGDATIVEFPLPRQAVDDVLESLAAAGLDTEEYRVILNAEAARTPRFRELEERYVTGDEEDDAISNEEIRSKAVNLNPGAVTYYAMTVLSAVVASAGLLLDSPAVVVGSMVIAPQVGSALMASVGAAIRDPDLFQRGLREQVFGLCVAIVAAAAFGLALRSAQFVPPALEVATITQISQRTSPGLLTLVVGIGAGAAGGFSLATELPVSLVGVAVAVAVIPAAAAVGIGVAWALPAVALGAAVVLVVNIASINLAAVAVFRYLGFGPESVTDGRDPDSFTAGVGVRNVVLALAMVALVVAGGALFAQQLSHENDTKTAVQDLLGSDRYSDLGLVSVHAGFVETPPVTTAPAVTVVVRRPPDQPYPALPERLEREVESQTGTNVTVSVEYVERATSSA